MNTRKSVIKGEPYTSSTYMSIHVIYVYAADFAAEWIIRMGASESSVFRAYSQFQDDPPRKIRNGKRKCPDLDGDMAAKLDAAKFEESPRPKNQEKCNPRECKSEEIETGTDLLTSRAKCVIPAQFPRRDADHQVPNACANDCYKQKRFHYRSLVCVKSCVLAQKFWPRKLPSWTISTPNSGIMGVIRP